MVCQHPRWPKHSARLRLDGTLLTGVLLTGTMFFGILLTAACATSDPDVIGAGDPGRTGTGGPASTAVAAGSGVTSTSSGSPQTRTSTNPSVRVETTNCAGTVTGRASGARLASGVVATVAHVLEVRATITLRDADGGTAPAEVVYLDIDRDIALIQAAPSTVNEAVLPLGEPLLGPAALLTFANRDLGPQIEEASIVRLAHVTLDGVGRRAAARLEGDINPGDSGSPVVQDDHLVAMVFASTRNVDRGWAIAAKEIELALDELARNGPNVEPISC